MSWGDPPPPPHPKSCIEAVILGLIGFISPPIVPYHQRAEKVKFQAENVFLLPGVVCQEFRSFGSGQKSFGGQCAWVHLRTVTSGVLPCPENSNNLKLVVN